MNSSWKALYHLAVISVILASCDGEARNTRPYQPVWNAELLVTGGVHPVLSTNDSSFLFTRTDGGLFLWHNGQESRITESGVVVRSDYTWSVSGDGHFAYSVPGSPGDGRITVSSLAGESRNLWDRGSTPFLNYNDGYLLCSGPQGDSTENGVWKFSLQDSTRERLSANAAAGRTVSNGQMLAFLEPRPQSNGLRLQVRMAQSDSILLSIDHVAKLESRFHLPLLGIEVITNPDDVLNTTDIYLVDILNVEHTQFIANAATDVVLLQDGSLLYNQIDSGQLGSLVLYENGAATIISDSLFDASGHTKHIVLATGVQGIYRLTLN